MFKGNLSKTLQLQLAVGVVAIILVILTRVGVLTILPEPTAYPFFLGLALSVISYLQRAQPKFLGDGDEYDEPSVNEINKITDKMLLIIFTISPQSTEISRSDELDKETKNWSNIDAHLEALPRLIKNDLNRLFSTECKFVYLDKPTNNLYDTDYEIEVVRDTLAKAIINNKYETATPSFLEACGLVHVCRFYVAIDITSLTKGEAQELLNSIEFEEDGFAPMCNEVNRLDKQDVAHWAKVLNAEINDIELTFELTTNAVSGLIDTFNLSSEKLTAAQQRIEENCKASFEAMETEVLLDLLTTPEFYIHPEVVRDILLLRGLSVDEIEREVQRRKTMKDEAVRESEIKLEESSTWFLLKLFLIPVLLSIVLLGIYSLTQIVVFIHLAAGIIAGMLSGSIGGYIGGAISGFYDPSTEFVGNNKELRIELAKEGRGMWVFGIFSGMITAALIGTVYCFFGSPFVLLGFLVVTFVFGGLFTRLMESYIGESVIGLKGGIIGGAVAGELGGAFSIWLLGIVPIEFI